MRPYAEYWTRVSSKTSKGRECMKIFSRFKKPEKQSLVDPICGMTIDENNVKYRTEYKGKTFYFCSARCKAQFKKDTRSHAPTQTNQKKKKGKASCH